MPVVFAMVSDRVANTPSNTVTKLLASTGAKTVGTYPVGANPHGIAFYLL